MPGYAIIHLPPRDVKSTTRNLLFIIMGDPLMSIPPLEPSLPNLPVRTFPREPKFTQELADTLQALGGRASEIRLRASSIGEALATRQEETPAHGHDATESLVLHLSYSSRASTLTFSINNGFLKYITSHSSPRLLLLPYSTPRAPSSGLPHRGYRTCRFYLYA